MNLFNYEINPKIMKHFSVFSLIGWLILSLVWSGCKDEVKPTSMPVVVTGEVSGVTALAANVSGQVISDGNLPVTERGIVLSESADPTTSATKFAAGSGTGTFSVELSGLVPATTYHVRAYAINSKATSYGLDKTFMSSVGAPILSTSQVSSIGYNTGTGGGEVTMDGGATITLRGICWSTNANPTTADNKTSDGSGGGSFVSSISGLMPATKYYVRSFAVNNVGVGYGPQVSFTTLTPPASAAVDIDGNVYESVTIGTQIWMKENLKVSRYRNGDVIPNVTSAASWAALTTGAWCNYNDDPANNSIYGKHYNWFTVVDSRQLCPSGWHIPNDSEWEVLTTFLGGIDVAGGKMKSTGTMYWQPPNTNATNSSGFSALPAGYRGADGTFTGGLITINGSWWSSTSIDAGTAWARGVYYNLESVYPGRGNKPEGLTIRCLKD